MKKEDGVTLLPFKDFLVQVVTEHWTRNNSGLLLSRIGQLCTKTGYRLDSELGKLKLANFIQDKVGHAIELVSPDNSSLHLQAVPKMDLSSTAEPFSSTSNENQSPLRLNRTILLAFSRPIPEGHQRRLQLEPYVRFWDQIPPIADIPGRLQIEETYIVKQIADADAQTTHSLVRENVQRWMHDNSLDITKFSGSRDKSVSKPHEQNLLTLLIAALNENELKRVNLPLDVIAKLLKK